MRRDLVISSHALSARLGACWDGTLAFERAANTETTKPAVYITDEIIDRFIDQNQKYALQYIRWFAAAKWDECRRPGLVYDPYDTTQIWAYLWYALDELQLRKWNEEYGPLHGLLGADPVINEAVRTVTKAALAAYNAIGART